MTDKILGILLNETATAETQQLSGEDMTSLAEKLEQHRATKKMKRLEAGKSNREELRDFLSSMQQSFATLATAMVAALQQPPQPGNQQPLPPPPAPRQHTPPSPPHQDQ